jgi:hypothetical protein
VPLHRDVFKHGADHCSVIAYCAAADVNGFVDCVGLFSLFRCLGRTKASVQVRGFVFEYFVTKIHFHGEELLAPRPTPKLVNHPLSAARDCLFNIFTTTLHIGDCSCIRNLRTRHAVVTGTHSLDGLRM